MGKTTKNQKAPKTKQQVNEPINMAEQFWIVFYQSGKTNRTYVREFQGHYGDVAARESAVAYGKAKALKGLTVAVFGPQLHVFEIREPVAVPLSWQPEGQPRKKENEEN